MADETARAERYSLSFTSGALLLREAAIAAPIFLVEGDWTRVRAVLEEENLLQARTVASAQRLSREVVQRLAVLTNQELSLLAEGTTTERGHLLWLAVCRRYQLVGEFAEEVLRERFLLLKPSLTHDDFDSFMVGKALWHDEIARLKQSTLRKLRANVFRMLIEAGLLTEDGRILPAVLSASVSDVLSDRTPSDIRFFPAGDDA